MIDAKLPPRKMVATAIHALIDELDPAQFTVQPDPTNPYAVVVVHAGKRFRVLVKEVA